MFKGTIGFSFNQEYFASYLEFESAQKWLRI